MSSKKLPVLLVALLLKASGSRAQAAPSPAPVPDPDYQQVSMPVPRAISLITDVARVMLSREPGRDKVQALIDRRRARSAKGDQSLTISVPKNKITRTLGLVE